ncbi:hypothetical protein [Thalassobacillus hwangdonensis]|uniref:DUF4179 domain-containing protein n=1 Tax=Thalassobacillus hwangdonensis TaxID=546108 RepID=A0ABW3KYB4_9BACI
MARHDDQWNRFNPLEATEEEKEQVWNKMQRQKRKNNRGKLTYVFYPASILAAAVIFFLLVMNYLPNDQQSAGPSERSLPESTIAHTTFKFEGGNDDWEISGEAYHFDYTKQLENDIDTLENGLGRIWINYTGDKKKLNEEVDISIIEPMGKHAAQFKEFDGTADFGISPDSFGDDYELNIEIEMNGELESFSLKPKKEEATYPLPKYYKVSQGEPFPEKWNETTPLIFEKNGISISLDQQHATTLSYELQSNAFDFTGVGPLFYIESDEEEIPLSITVADVDASDTIQTKIRDYDGVMDSPSIGVDESVMTEEGYTYEIHPEFDKYGLKTIEVYVNKELRAVFTAHVVPEISKPVTE